MTSTKETSSKKPRGFATLSPERMREIASLGGRRAHETGRAHQFSSAEGRAAGLKRAEQMRQQGFPGRKRKQPEQPTTQA